MERWTWLADWLTIGTIALVLWTFVPRGVRRVIWAALRWLGGGFVELAYALVGVDHPGRQAAPKERRSGYRGSRSPSGRERSAHSNAPNASLPHREAEADRVQHSRSAFGVQADPPRMSTIDPRLPQHVDELQKLTRAIIIHAQSPRGAKQKGIFEAWGARPGGGPEWERASALFDLAVPPKARGASSAEAVEDLEMQPAP
jgi:hypothetical protein